MSSSNSPNISHHNVPQTNDCKILSGINLDQLRDVINKEVQNAVNHCMNTYLGCQLKDIRDEILEFKKSMEYFNCKFDDIQKWHDNNAGTLDSLSHENASLKKQITDLTQGISAIEQQTRSSNIEVQFLPESKSENLITIVKQLGDVVKCPINDDNILHCTRTAKFNTESNRPRSVVVKLTSPRLRDNLLAACAQYNRTNANEKLHSGLLGYGGSKKTPIFVAEHLTPGMKSLHAAARLKAKELKFKFVWIRNSKIFMRKTETSEYIHINNLETLNRLTNSTDNNLVKNNN